MSQNPTPIKKKRKERITLEGNRISRRILGRKTSGIVRRFIAYTIDWVMVVITSIGIASLWRGDEQFVPVDAGLNANVIVLNSADFEIPILALLYFTFVLYWWNGRTLGKSLCNIQVVRLDGKSLTLWDCFSRFFGYAASALSGGLGFLQAFWDPNRQSMHDKIVSTVVLLRRGKPKMQQTSSERSGEGASDSRRHGSRRPSRPSGQDSRRRRNSRSRGRYDVKRDRPQDSRDTRNPKDSKGATDTRDSRDSRDTGDSKGPNDTRETADTTSGRRPNRRRPRRRFDGQDGQSNKPISQEKQDKREEYIRFKMESEREDDEF